MTNYLALLTLVSLLTFAGNSQIQPSEKVESTADEVVRMDQNGFANRIYYLQNDLLTRDMVQGSCCQSNQQLEKKTKDGDITDPELSGITTYPNPTRGDIALKLPEDLIGHDILVMDMSGRLVGEPTPITGQTETITIEGETGVYLIVVRTEAHVFTSRVLLEK